MRFFLVLIVFVSGCLQAEVTEDPNVVVRIIDGDTIELSSGETVRLLCVDTPEIGEDGYQEAKDFTSALLGKSIILESGTENRDRYGRILRFVYVEENGTLVNFNKRLLERDLAILYVNEHNQDTCYMVI